MRRRYLRKEGLGLGSKLFTMVADTGVAAFRTSGVSRALQVTWRAKYAFEEASTPQAFAVLDLWLIRTMNVSFLLLDPSTIARITGEYLDWARAAGDSAWDTEITTDRAMAVESEIVRAKDAMKYDAMILLRRVLASHIPEPTQFTQAHWVSGQDALL